MNSYESLICCDILVAVAGQCCFISVCDTMKSRVKWDTGGSLERWGTKVIR